jgi:pilus assembly protein FimV
MNRKLFLLLNLLGSLVVSQAQALGLGNITLESHLNEPLVARIQLVSAERLTERDVLVNLAPQADFDRAQVDRSILLNHLAFGVDLSDSRHPVIVVTTDEPVREPYLDFIVEMQSPMGRVLREYTLLLDIAPNNAPSRFKRRAVAADSQVAAPKKHKLKAEATKPVPAPVAPPAPASVQTAAPAAVTPPAQPAPVAATPPSPAVDNTAQVVALNAQLTSAQEQANQASIQNAALKQQAASLEKQLADAKTQLETQSAQMQSMQVALEQQKQQQAAQQAQAAAQQAASQTASAPQQQPAPVAVQSPAEKPVSEPVVAQEPVVQKPAKQKPTAQKPAPKPEPQPVEEEHGSSWGIMALSVIVLLLIGAGLWFVRHKQIKAAEGGVPPAVDTHMPVVDTQTPVDEAANEIDEHLNALQHAAEKAPSHHAAEEAEAPALSTDEALDLLLAETKMPLESTLDSTSVRPAVDEPITSFQPSGTADTVVREAVTPALEDELQLPDSNNWSEDFLSTETTAVDKEFVFEPELFADNLETPTPTIEPEVAPAPAPAAVQDTAVDDAFRDATDRDFVVTKLELAKQYFDMGDIESAKDLLGEVLEEGDAELIQAANDMLGKM